MAENKPWVVFELSLILGKSEAHCPYKIVLMRNNDDNYGPRRNGVVYKMGVTLVTIGQFWLVVPVGQKVVVAI